MMGGDKCREEIRALLKNTEDVRKHYDMEIVVNLSVNNIILCMWSHNRVDYDCVLLAIHDQ